MNKKFKCIFLALCMMAFMCIIITSCKEKIEVVPSYLELSPETLGLGSSGEKSETFEVKSNVDWEAKADVDWLTLSTEKGSGEGSVTVTASTNPNEKNREGNISVTGGGIEKKIKVVQGFDIFKVTNLTLDFVAGATGEINITTSQTWSISGVPEWLEMSESSGTGDATVTVTTKEENETTENRMANIEVTAGGRKKTVKVTQKCDVLAVTQSLVLNASQNSSGTIKIMTARAWSIEGVPNWLKLSTYNGTGETDVTVTALERNLNTEPHVATLTVKAGIQEAEVTVTQHAGMSVTISDYILLSNGYSCKFSFGTSVSGYTETLYNASYFDSHDEETIQQELESRETSSNSDTDAMYVNLPSQTEFVCCVAPYAMVNGTKKWGKFVSKRITTPSSSASAGVNISLISTLNDATYGSLWKFSVTTSETYYYILGYNNNVAETGVADIVNGNAPDIMFAEIMLNNPSQTYSSLKGDLYYPRGSSDYALLILAWGGSSYGNLTKRYRNLSSGINLHPSTPSMAEKRHKCGKAEIREWEETVKKQIRGFSPMNK